MTLKWTQYFNLSTHIFKWQLLISFDETFRFSRGLSRFLKCARSPSSSRWELGHLDRNTLRQVEKSPVPHLWCSDSKSSGARAILSHAFPFTAKWCFSPGAEVLLLFFFLLFFLANSEASASSLSSFKSPPLRSWGSTSCCGCSSAMIRDLEMKWRISCREPPVVKAEKCAGGRWANNELLDHLCSTTWPGYWKTSLPLSLSPQELEL